MIRPRGEKTGKYERNNTTAFSVDSYRAYPRAKRALVNRRRRRSRRGAFGQGRRINLEGEKNGKKMEQSTLEKVDAQRERNALHDLLTTADK